MKKQVKIAGVVVKDLDGKGMPDTKMGKVIANALTAPNAPGDSIELYELALDFNKCQDLVLNSSDVEAAMSAIEAVEGDARIGFSRLASAQARMLLRDAEQIKEEEPEENGEGKEA